MHDSADNLLDLPDYDLQITVTPVKARPRRLGREIGAVDRLAALGRGEPDPGDFRPTLISHEAADDLRALFEDDHRADS